ncbi:hypothetical protein EJ02DRAFT_252334 [Clathrospora elynae]|uniref:DUF4604 domain-containing protein n=1 Tax=Clathrospora elynae TaxID=706981 RepID=A0A6A5SGE3_9PLEO|nr:hypothetical protein EJ02DRAFT_252334 [Clathrospora elynae]
MSFKAKDLQFDDSQPAFLQRLRGQLMSGDSARHEQPIARNKRMQKDDEEEDAPTYVMEETNDLLTKEEYAAFVSGKDSKKGEDGKAQPKDGASEATTKPKDKITEVGANAKKRKAPKVIGDDQEQNNETSAKKTDARVVKKSKKKAKAVKLTFGDEDEG